jgi:hypothetical protein
MNLYMYAYMYAYVCAHMYYIYIYHQTSNPHTHIPGGVGILELDEEGAFIGEIIFTFCGTGGVGVL